MLKNTVLYIVATVVLAFAVTSIGIAAEQNYRIINGLQYHKIMYRAVASEELMTIKFGFASENLGGYEQDVKRVTEGFPPAFREGSSSDEVWILDSVNSAIKLFKAGKFVKKIDLKNMGNVTDFALSKDGKFAVLNQFTGYVFVIDQNGKVLSVMTGFSYATSLEFANEKELLITHPMAGGIARVSMEGALIELYEGDETLSNHSNDQGLWGLECAGLKKAKLFVRTGVEPADFRVVAEIPFATYRNVEYKGGKIYGFDASGNVYFGLIACDPNGVIYRERLYKCNTNGKILKEKDILDRPGMMAPRAPRHRIVRKDGKIVAFSASGKGYTLYKWDM